MNVPFLDLSISDRQQQNALLTRIRRLLDSGHLVMGRELMKFEQQVARYCKRNYALGVGSGTEALYLSLRALDIGPGDEVITTPLSWIATANAIALTGASPVFADISDDLNIDPDTIEPLISQKTRAILFVDYTGKICQIRELQLLAKRHQLHLIEDGSQAFGAEYHHERCGSFGNISAISHNPMKILAACGEAGSILYDDEELHERLIALRYNGTVDREFCIEPSLNCRMDTMQAVILLERLQNLEARIRARRENASYYNEMLAKYVRIPRESNNCRDVYYTYTIQSAQRDLLKEYLEGKGIEVKIYHQPLMPHQTPFRNAPGRFPKAEEIIHRILCLPIHESMTEAQREYVAQTIVDFGDTRP